MAFLGPGNTTVFFREPLLLWFLCFSIMPPVLSTAVRWPLVLDYTKICTIIY